MHLKDTEYCVGIEGIIQALDTDDTLHNVNMSIKWDTLKARIKEYSIRYGVVKAKQKHNETKSLENELNVINNKMIWDNNDILRKEFIQNRLHDIYTEMSNGSQIRAKVETIHEVECNKQLRDQLQVMIIFSKVICH